MSTADNKHEKAEKLKEIRELVQGFCDRHLNRELAGYALKLSATLGRKRKLDVARGRKEIWAAAIVYVIARLNFLFDPGNEYFLTADTIYEFFGTKKTTVGSKATQIEKACDISLGAEGFCSPEISEMFALVQLPNGLVVPESMLSDIVYEMADGEESEQIEKFFAGRPGIRSAEPWRKKHGGPRSNAKRPKRKEGKSRKSNWVYLTSFDHQGVLTGHKTLKAPKRGDGYGHNSTKGRKTEAGDPMDF